MELTWGGGQLRRGHIGGWSEMLLQAAWFTPSIHTHLHPAWAKFRFMQKSIQKNNKKPKPFINIFYLTHYPTFSLCGTWGYGLFDIAVNLLLPTVTYLSQNVHRRCVWRYIWPVIVRFDLFKYFPTSHRSRVRAVERYSPRKILTIVFWSVAIWHVFLWWAKYFLNRTMPQYFENRLLLPPHWRTFFKFEIL